MIFAIVVFVFAMLILMYVWVTVSGQFSISYGSGIYLIQTQLQNMGTNLMQQGRPIDWDSIVNTTNTATWSNLTVGLENQNGTGLSYSKVMTLAAMSNTNYSETKALLGVGYDYYIKIVGGNFNIQIGRNPFSANILPVSVQVLNEPVVVGGVPAQMNIEVWTNTTFGIG
jgi:hypothetical protein